MPTKDQIFEMIKSKGRWSAIRVNTSGYSYWGRLYEYTEQVIVLKPYYTNKEKDLQLHDNGKAITLDEIIDID